MKEDTLLILWLFSTGFITGWIWRDISIQIKNIIKANRQLRKIKEQK